MNSSTTRFVKVSQGKPKSKTWFQWHRLMHLIGDELSCRPLGKWLSSGHRLRRNWPCYMDLRSKFLYIRSAKGFVQYARTQSGDYDHVYGFRESSYRSEGYGVLSTVRFVFHLFTFCGCVPKWRYEYMADNKGLLTAILQDSKYTEAFPNTTLEADWDIRNEIKATLKLIGLPNSFSHVKGHQDNGQCVESLDLPAQLNVEADREANAFRAAYPSHRPSVPRLGHNRAQLHIGGRTINGKYRQEIRLTHHAQVLVDGGPYGSDRLESINTSPEPEQG
jgi:hypothetical protein